LIVPGGAHEKPKGRDDVIRGIKSLFFVLMLLSLAGCSLLNTALSAGVAYGIYQLSK